jgi:hypothetical protein
MHNSAPALSRSLRCTFSTTLSVRRPVAAHDTTPQGNTSPIRPFSSLRQMLSSTPTGTCAPPGLTPAPGDSLCIQSKPNLDRAPRYLHHAPAASQFPQLHHCKLVPYGSRERPAAMLRGLNHKLRTVSRTPPRLVSTDTKRLPLAATLN